MYKKSKCYILKHQAGDSNIGLDLRGLVLVLTPTLEVTKETCNTQISQSYKG